MRSLSRPISAVPVLAAVFLVSGCGTAEGGNDAATQTVADPAHSESVRAANSASEGAAPVHPQLGSGERGRVVAFLDGQSGTEMIAHFAPTREVVSVRVHCEGNGTIRVRSVAADGGMASSEWECEERQSADTASTGFQSTQWDDVSIFVDGDPGTRWGATVVEQSSEEARIPSIAEQEQTPEGQQAEGQAPWEISRLLEEQGITQERFWQLIEEQNPSRQS